LANELLEKRLNKHGHRQSKLAPGLWKHDTRPMQFTLVVDNSGVKCVGEEHAQHLKNTLEEHYTLTCDWTGTRYIGITLDWDYKKRQVHLSMPNYMKKALKQFQHIAGKLQYTPYPSVPIQYGTKKQYATQESTAPLLDDKAKCFIQQVCGKILFLGRAVDSTLFCPIRAIASQLSKTDHRYDAANTSTPRLSSHTGGCSTLLSRQLLLFFRVLCRFHPHKTLHPLRLSSIIGRWTLLH